jgi:hypothetical protein
LKDINDFIHLWHCVKQPHPILTLSNSWHERFSEKAEIKDIKLQKNLKILMTTVPPGGLFEYTRRQIFVSASASSALRISNAAFCIYVFV